MTPQATKLYFELLDEQSEKLATLTGKAAKLLEDLIPRAKLLGIDPGNVSDSGALASLQKAVTNAENLASPDRMPFARPKWWQWSEQSTAEKKLYDATMASRKALNNEYNAALRDTQAAAAEASAQATHTQRMRQLDPNYKMTDAEREAAAAAAAAAAPDAAAAAGGGKSKGVPLWAVGTGAAALGLGAGALGHTLGSTSATDAANANNTRNKWLSYGGGMATGLAAPSLLKGVNSFVRNQGLMPPGSYDEYDGSSDFTSI